MAELNVRLNLNFRLTQNMARWLMACGFLAALAVEVSPESMTLNTYYPAPSGIYTNMITTQQTYLARDSGNVGVGTTVPNGKLDVEGVGNVVLNAGRVGVGTAAPQYPLDVNGIAKVLGFQMPIGSPQAGMALTSDASGNGTWQWCSFAP
ncbi:MAG: hypothetical protein ACYCPQ_04075 [Elusimicrobiota bacterium]